ncbi:MAG: hypothetical protein Q8940_07205 [Bacteroidota bacterium]|nr:hypothetical protein [Bacteroidota bacterium]
MAYTLPVNPVRESNAVSYYAGMPLVDNNILPSNRIYDRRTGLLTFIEEGRSAFARLLLNYAKQRGAYVARDVETRWGIEYKRLPRLYFNGASSSTSGAKNDVFSLDTANGARIQKGDIFALMGFYVPSNRDVNPLSNDVPVLAKSTSAPLPELVQVNLVNKTATGYEIIVDRNFLGTNLNANGDASMAMNATSGDVANYGNFFLWKMSPSLTEGSDDQQIYSDLDDWDYNYCQIIMRKWGATETEQNVDRFFGRPGETTFQRNARRSLGEFFDEFDVTALLGVRNTRLENGRRKWYAGGFMEFVPTANYIGYSDSMFITKNFNEVLKNKFYFGAQTKIILGGDNFYTKASNMLDNKIILPASTNSWGLELVRFRAANGGNVLFANSDTMSLNGMSDYGILFDPETFQYGHLQNMDIKQIKPTTTNPHEEVGEIYGQVTFKRSNPDANYVFLPE